MKGKVAYIPQARTLEFHEFELPDVGPGAILAQVTRTNVCGSEVHMWRGEFGKRGVMPGHEMVGRVYKLGKGVTTDTAGQPLKEGDRIAPVYYRTCGLCVNCREGNAFDGRLRVIAHIRLDAAVAHAHRPPRPGGDVIFMGDHDDGFALVVELAQEPHDLVARVRVEIAGRLVRQNDMRIVDQGTGDGHALLLAAGKLRGPVIEPIA